MRRQWDDLPVLFKTDLFDPTTWTHSFLGPSRSPVSHTLNDHIEVP
jgi:hypothetical protein